MSNDEERERKRDQIPFAIDRDVSQIEKIAKTQTIVEANLDLRSNRKLRWQYARWVFYYLVLYSAFVGIVLIIAGFGIWGFDLPHTVLEFLVGSTAVSAIGLVLAVTHGLFGRR